MLFYLLNLALNMLVGLCLLGSAKKNDTQKKIYLFFTAVQLILISGLRGISVGVDTIGYKDIYDSAIKATTLKELTEQRTEIFYLLICVFSFKVYGGFQLVLLITSAIIVVGFILLIREFSENYLFSVFLLFTLTYYQASMNITRHFLATVFILNSIKYIKKKQFVKYLLMMLVAFCFHRTAIVLLPLYFIQYIKWSPKMILGFVLGVLVLFALLRTFFEIGLRFFPVYSGYINSMYGQPNQGLLRLVVDGSISILLIGVILYRLIANLPISEKSHLYFTVCMIGFACLILSYNIQIMAERFGVYFSPFYIVAIPSLLKLIKSKELRAITTTGLIITCIVHYVIMLSLSGFKSVPYVPFWA